MSQAAPGIDLPSLTRRRCYIPLPCYNPYPCTCACLCKSTCACQPASMLHIYDMQDRVKVKAVTVKLKVAEPTAKASRKQRRASPM